MPNNISRCNVWMEYLLHSILARWEILALIKSRIWNLFRKTQMSIKISPNEFLIYELHVIWNICFAILQYQSIPNENIWFEIDVVLEICVEYLYLALCTSFHRKISPLSVASHCKQRRGIAPINSIFRSLNISQKK